MGHWESNPKREIHSIASLSQKNKQTNKKKQKKLKINNLTLHLQELEEQQETKPRASRRKELTKIRAELNNAETKRPIQKQ